MKHISAITNVTVEENKKFAWIPIKLASGKFVWLTNYYEVVNFISINTMIRMLHYENFSVDEYVVRKLSR